MIPQSQPNLNQGLDILSRLSGVQLVDNRPEISRLNMLMAQNDAIKQGLLPLGTSPEIDPYAPENQRPESVSRPIQTVPVKTMTYEQQQELTRARNIELERQRIERLKAVPVNQPYRQPVPIGAHSGVETRNADILFQNR